MTKNFNPLVSIIIPVYNGSNYMCEAIDSAIAQTYKNVEIIVVNDGSTDNTDEIAKSYGDKIQYYKKENGGVATALNLAIKKSKGEYISWLSHDDMYYPEKVEKQIKELTQLKEGGQEKTILWSNYSLINEKSDITSTQSFQEVHNVEKLNYIMYPILKGLIHGCTLLIPKKGFEEIGYFDEKLKTTQDYDLWFKMFPHYKLIFSEDVLVKSRWHDEQGSKTIITTSDEADELWINMIKNLSREQKIKIDGSIIKFLENTLTIVAGANYLGAKEYLERLISEYKNRNIADIKVSVIIPFYNRVKWTVEAIESVIKQTHRNIEIIVVNDHSTVDITEIEKFVKNDERVKLINNKRTKGVSGSRNTGLDIARGEFIAFLDSDDLFLPTKIEKQLTFMVRNGYLFSHTSYLLFNDNIDNIQLINSGNINYLFPNIIAGCVIATPTVIISRCLVQNENLEFPESFFGGEDTCFWIDISKAIVCIGYDEALVRVRNHGKNFAYDDLKQLQGLSNILSYVSANYLNDDTVCYISQLNEKIVYKLNELNIDDKKKIISSSSSNLSSRLVLKSKIRKILYKIIWTISPSFRMQVGNKHRLNQILTKVSDLESAIDSKTQNLKQSIDWLKKEYKLEKSDLTLNLLGDILHIDANHKSITKKYDCSDVEFFERMKKFILKTEIILDIGAGIRPQTFFTPKVHICVEPFEQYRDVIKPFFPNQSHFIFLKKGGLEAMQDLDDNSIDSVFMIDLIEHLEKDDGKKLLKEADRIARKQIVVFTPLGFYPMHFKEKGQKDAWGLDGVDVQEHKSGWLPEDFGESWDFHICVDCHDAFLPEEKKQGKKYSALMAIKTKKFDGFSISNETPDFVKDVFNQRVIESNLEE